MIGGVTRYMLPHLSGVPHFHVNGPLVMNELNYQSCRTMLQGNWFCVLGHGISQTGWNY